MGCVDLRKAYVRHARAGGHPAHKEKSARNFSLTTTLDGSIQILKVDTSELKFPYRFSLSITRKYPFISASFRMMYEKNPFVYIMAGDRNGTLYIGVTGNLIERVWRHKHEKKGFTGRYEIFNLVYFERNDSMQGAIDRETRLKKWNRHWKIRLIEDMNPGWKDLWDDILH